MDLEEVIMMIRAVCSAKKGPTSLQELKKDYYELNGTYIPYKILGFETLVEFLESHPDKFNLINDKFTGELSIQPVVDEEISKLRSLVVGQKSAKKKSKPKKTNFRPGAPRFKQFQAYRSPNISNSNAFLPKSALSTQNRNRIHSIVTKNVRFNLDESTKSEAVMKKKNEIEPSLIENLVITNAAYFLKEHVVFISHVADCDKVYIRLVSENFSGKYDAMFKKMNDFYFGNSKTKVNEFEVNSVCVALNEMKHHRVQIKKILNKDQAECFHLDEGKTKIYSILELYEIDKEFLEVKFQAVLASIHQFENFHQSLYLKELISSDINNKQFTARKIQSNPLIISLFNTENECISENFLKKNEHFLKYKPEQNSKIEAKITYIDEEAKLLYLEKPLSPLFHKYIIQFNNFFQDKNKKILECLNEAARRQTKNDDFVKNNLLCAKYEIDSNWYRVKFIKENSATNKALVLFVDFGNKDLVNLNEIYIIPDEFSVYKFLPYQCYPTTLISDITDMNYFKNFWYDSLSCNFKVVHFNPAGVPSVEFLEVVNTPSKSTNLEDELIDDFEKIDLNNNQNEVENFDDEKVVLNLKDLTEADLPVVAQVHIKYVNNPFDFVINDDRYLKAYEDLKEKMRNFYTSFTLDKYRVENFVKNSVYVCQKPNKEYIRVKFEVKFDNYAKIYDIDGGYYDAVRTENLFHITRKFIELKPLAIKARLASVQYDRNDRWSDEAKKFFIQIADKSTSFKSSVCRFDYESNSYALELAENSIGLLSRMMVKAGLAVNREFI